MQTWTSPEVFISAASTLIALAALALSWWVYRRQTEHQEGNLLVECKVAIVEGADGWGALDISVRNTTKSRWIMDSVILLKPKRLEGIARHQIMEPTSSGGWTELSLKQKPGRRFIWMSGTEIIPIADGGITHDERIYVRVPGSYAAAKAIFRLRFVSMEAKARKKVFTISRALPESLPNKGSENLLSEPVPRDRPRQRLVRKHTMPVTGDRAR